MTRVAAPDRAGLLAPPERDDSLCPWCSSDSCEDVAHVGRPLTAADIPWSLGPLAATDDDVTARLRTLALAAIDLADDPDVIDVIVVLADLALDGVGRRHILAQALDDLVVLRRRQERHDERRQEAT